MHFEVESTVKEKMAKRRAREENNYRELYRAVTGKTFFVSDEGKDSNQLLKEILNLKEKYEHILELDERDEHQQNYKRGRGRTL